MNLALEPRGLTLFDWGIATVGPAELDAARLLVGCAHILDLSFDEFLALQREVAGADHDEASLELALLAGLTWLGWNKALDIVEHPDEGSTCAASGQDWTGGWPRQAEPSREDWCDGNRGDAP